jgi:hydroxymethylpyrimidine kinase/phosphomethylpyrimidine kinase/thiamine-phosphate diphosphorylase
MSQTNATDCLLIIAGHDPSSGAGIGADMAAATALGVHALTAITALTIQNSQGVQAVHAVPAMTLRAQVQALRADFTIAAVKIGMLGSHEMVATVIELLSGWDIPVVMDTVFKASAGASLLDMDARSRFVHGLLPLATLLTPNIPEAEQLTGLPIATRAAQLQAAQQLQTMGAQSVLLKGGHFEDDQAADLLLLADGRVYWLVSDYLNTPHSHGSGCVLASSIAAGMVQGFDVLSAVVQAKARVHGGIAASKPLGQGVGAVATHGWFAACGHFPTVIQADMPSLLATDTFPAMLHSMAIYPIVDVADKLLPLLDAGCRTLQLRIKSDDKAYIAAQIARAVALCFAYPDSQLFINDHWQLAVQAGAFGVHLGQEDWHGLSSNEQAQVRASGLRLGLSSHNLGEMALAHAARPSYIAIGPLFGTTSKQIAHPAVGVRQLTDWLQWLRPCYPVVTIGGVEATDIADVKACGVDGIAVIGAMVATNEQGATERALHLMQLWQAA